MSGQALGFLLGVQVLMRCKTISGFSRGWGEGARGLLSYLDGEFNPNQCMDVFINPKKNICKRWHEKPKTTHGDKTVLYPCFHFTLVISKHLKAGKMINGLINFYNLS